MRGGGEGNWLERVCVSVCAAVEEEEELKRVKELTGRGY